jgi:hypothetical protein
MVAMSDTPLNSYQYAIPKAKKIEGEEQWSVPDWHCYRCFTRTEKVLPTVEVGKNWKQRINSEVKRSAIMAKPRITRYLFPVRCYKECEGEYSD